MRFDGTRGDAALEGARRRRRSAGWARAGVEAVAVCYLHAYRDPRHERATRKLLARLLPDAYVSLSSEVLPQIKEYERVCTTVVNAYVGPVLGALPGQPGRAPAQGGLPGRRAHHAVARRRRADRGRGAAGRRRGPLGPRRRHRGEPLLRRACSARATSSPSTWAGPAPTSRCSRAASRTSPATRRWAASKVALPSIDIHTLGAGGGSIARVDAGGILHVGPESAGAEPGPACYGRGGTAATVTDANLVLG